MTMAHRYARSQCLYLDSRQTHTNTGNVASAGPQTTGQQDLVVSVCPGERNTAFRSHRSTTVCRHGQEEEEEEEGDTTETA